MSSPKTDVAGQLGDAYLALRYVESVVFKNPKGLPQLSHGERCDLASAVILVAMTASRLGIVLPEPGEPS